MKREAMRVLMDWKSKAGRKPMIIRGARQVGKTWLMKEFGRQAFANVVYLNFEQNPMLRTLFDSDFSIPRIIEGLELISGQRIAPNQTLLIFDEIQEAPAALASLKYFSEDAPEYTILCAGSLLGVALHRGTSFPVGKVEFLDLYPLHFLEFITALGEERAADVIRCGDWGLSQVLRPKLEQLLRQYYYIGGMPEAVEAFRQRRDYAEVRTIQERILAAYEQDFSKHAPNEQVPRIRMLWRSIPSQLAKENRKFVYSSLREGARAREYETAMLWLLDCGLIHKVHRVSTPHLPLRAYEDPKAFKLFVVDIGILACLSGLTPDTLLRGNVLFSEFKGALTEQYVLQQLIAQHGLTPFYWMNDRGNAEVDFLIESEGKIIPIEVKAESNLKSKSLAVYRDKFEPDRVIRTAMVDYHPESWLVNVPLWGIGSEELFWM